MLPSYKIAQSYVSAKDINREVTAKYNIGSDWVIDSGLAEGNVGSRLTAVHNILHSHT